MLIFRRQASRGFTLIELLVSLLVASIFLLATAMIVIETMRLDREETGRTQVQAELTQAMEYIRQDLAEALYIYNDTEQNPQQPDRLGDRIPDVIQRLYAPGWIRRPDDAIPVVAFWKLEPIPQGCYEGNPTLQDIRRGNATLPAQPPPEFPRDQNGRNADWDTLVSRRGIYTLVVYYLRRNYNNAGNPTGALPGKATRGSTVLSCDPSTLRVKITAPGAARSLLRIPIRSEMVSLLGLPSKLERAKSPLPAGQMAPA